MKVGNFHPFWACISACEGREERVPNANVTNVTACISTQAVNFIKNVKLVSNERGKLSFFFLGM